MVNSYETVSDPRTGPCIYSFTCITLSPSPDRVLIGLMTDWVLYWQPNKSLYSFHSWLPCLPSHDNAKRDQKETPSWHAFLLAKVSSDLVQGLWSADCQPMLGWAHQDLTRSELLRGVFLTSCKCISPSPIAVYNWCSWWKVIMILWIICVCLQVHFIPHLPEQMCKANVKGNVFGIDIWSDYLAFHSLTGSCEMWKTKRQTHNYYQFYFLKYPQIIAFKYKQGHLQQWLLYPHSVCFRINMADTLGCNYLLSCLSLT